MIKRMLFLAIAFLSTTLLHSQTIYQTMDIGGGVIKWSTDGGVTDCGGTPDYGDKQDEIHVNHPYTFSAAFFNGDDIEAYFEINTSSTTPVIFDGFINKRERSWLINNSTVTFNDGVFSRVKAQGQNSQEVIINNSNVTCNGSFKIDQSTALISLSTVVFNSTCEVFGVKNHKAGNLYVSNNSDVTFNDNVFGDATGEGLFTFDSSNCTFKTGINISGVRMNVGELAILTINNSVTINTSEIYVVPNASIIMLNNITVLGSSLSANTANLILGTGAIFSNGAVLTFGDQVTGFFWGSTSFDNVEIFLKAGCVMGFTFGWKPKILHMISMGIIPI